MPSRINLDKLDELHQYGKWEVFHTNTVWVYNEDCTLCYKPWPCQVARLSQALRAAYAELDGKVEPEPHLPQEVHS